MATGGGNLDDDHDNYQGTEEVDIEGWFVTISRRGLYMRKSVFFSQYKKGEDMSLKRRVKQLELKQRNPQ